MSLAPFTFAHDRPSRTVIATLRGHWTMATVDAYRAAVLADIRTTVPGHEPHNALFDIRDCGLHVRGVADAMVDFRRDHIPDMARIAIVSHSALDAMQARRITAAREYGVFTTIEAAREWLGQPPT
jgi:hypothetical protein